VYSYTSIPTYEYDSDGEEHKSFYNHLMWDCDVVIALGDYDAKSKTVRLGLSTQAEKEVLRLCHKEVIDCHSTSVLEEMDSILEPIGYEEVLNIGFDGPCKQPELAIVNQLIQKVMKSTTQTVNVCDLRKIRSCQDERNLSVNTDNLDLMFVCGRRLFREGESYDTITLDPRTKKRMETYSEKGFPIIRVADAGNGTIVLERGGFEVYHKILRIESDYVPKNKSRYQFGFSIGFMSPKEYARISQKEEANDE